MIIFRYILIITALDMVKAYKASATTILTISISLTLTGFILLILAVHIVKLIREREILRDIISKHNEAEISSENQSENQSESEAHSNSIYQKQLQQCILDEMTRMESYKSKQNKSSVEKSRENYGEVIYAYAQVYPKTSDHSTIDSNAMHEFFV